MSARHDQARIDATAAALRARREAARNASPARRAKRPAANGDDTPAANGMPVDTGDGTATGVTASGASAFAMRRLADVQPQPIRWLWPGRIARGKVTLIAGHPGLGKSQLTASLAAVVTTGGRWPVDRSACERGEVILLNAEDDVADTIRPRLDAAGADCTRIHVIDAVRDVDREGRATLRTFNLKADIGRLALELERRPAVSLVIIDPASAYLGDTDSHVNAEVRALLAPMSEVAARHAVAIVMVSHLNKGGGSGEALLRVTGSLAFVAAARAAYVVTKDADDPARRLFLPMKNNVGPDATGLAFRLRGVTLPGGVETCALEWDSEPVAVTADEAMQPPQADDERSERADACGFLRGLLADGPVPSQQVQRDAAGAGHAWATVRRAAKELGVVVRKEGGRFGGAKQQWQWSLPDDLPDRRCSPSPEDAHTKRVSTFCASEHLLRAEPDAEQQEPPADIVRVEL